MANFLVRVRSYLWNTLERTLHMFITFHRRPIRSADFKRASAPTPNLPPYAMVLRGIVVTKNDFTLETLRFYKKLFPGAPLIVSTWEHTPEEVLAPMRAVEGVEIVLSKEPPLPGYGHSNYQITLAAAGIKRAEELGVKYVLKTRTDQRMYATDIYPYLYGLTETFPLTNANAQKKRLVALGFLTLKYRPYSLNDMLFFGTTSDVKLYWDIPYDERVLTKATTVGDWVQKKVCEGYFLRTFLKNIGHEVRESLEDYWGALAKYFVLVETHQLDFYWPKYARFEEYRDRQYNGVILGEEVNMKEWIIFSRDYTDAKKIPVDLENVPNDSHGARITLP